MAYYISISHSIDQRTIPQRIIPPLTGHRLKVPSPYDTMSSSRTNFTTLPFELQMHIFHDYFKVDGGYAFNGDSEKLTTANGKPIDLALMYTCRSIATQTKGMPLSLNTIHFSTVYRRDWTPLAGCFNFVTVLYPLLVADMFPDFASELRQKRPADFAQLIFETFPHWIGTHPAHEFLELGFNLWDIPSRSELARVTSRLDVDFVWQMVDQWHYKPPHCHDPSNPYDPLHKGARCREKTRFSAAAVSIRFLGRLNLQQRLQIRNVTLHEDFVAAGDPPSHAQGLAPFFIENSRLRVERRVSAMRCISEEDRLMCRPPYKLAWWLQEPGHPEHADYLTFRNSMPSPRFPRCLAQWLLKALDVPEAGIPAEAFTFVLEGGPYIDFCTNLFQQTVHRDIAWHKAYQASIQRGLFVRWPLLQTGLVVEGFAEAVEHLNNPTSFLRSDFNTGHPWDWENLVEEKTGVSQYT
ncbi:hypothetical protein BGZ61DRAFT_555897 [Ilyonectria robusta]|uniref:uncharacterized protein n=1 Tax=Ilyonectria robusta TaxID=1079257 RepID=UPI001E8EB7DF|nr:uncharacterized protein BGZ61DRAFT_555897 [Ilyonectria robusta]KAH8672226.1 hypothetical protein BGZ61DRAFT_555897 [Ilyonectria robusta]